ncbi:TPA: hypothetical protein ACK3Q6_002857 [Burkholderia cepacia]|uniref:hypothetical protein n=1 Tax=Burkholderia cepacia TaxID=292 RepID=UPI001C9352B3|nr:hypothetical protein [Burkholderia cepacia]HDR9757932.1 hypothetical protein [Burkholderia cepacia ATCC 25416]MBY4709827.1 hypothetical protein [Burkholderia cepacia]MBY4739335.1 hypothetical protein [Burkholderia cepacia]MBY4746455.1 hypothetical protein [Burkholderia cepacia]MBY4758169.1 hypothetical protein [Burkholderia cepacia]
MNNPSLETDTNEVNDLPNVVIYTRWHQVAPLSALFSPLLVVPILALFPSPTEVSLLAIAALIVVCIATPLILAHVVYPPAKDVVHIRPDALVFKRYGTVPFDSITAYTLDGLIRLTRQEQPTLVLLGNCKTPGYKDFQAALGPAMATWQSHHPTAPTKQSHFQGTWLAKVLGALIVISCVGLAITVVTMKLAMASLPALAIAIFGGIRLLASKREEIKK